MLPVCFHIWGSVYRLHTKGGELLQDHVQRNRCIFESYVVFGFELCYNIYYIQDDMIWLLTTAYTMI